MVIRKLLELETDETKKNSKEELSGTKKTERPEGKIAIWGAEPTEPTTEPTESTTEPTERVQSMVQSMGRGDVDVSNTVHAAHSRNALEIRYDVEGYEGNEGVEGYEGFEGYEGGKGDYEVSPYENENRCVDELLCYNSSYSMPYNYND